MIFHWLVVVRCLVLPVIFNVWIMQISREEEGKIPHYVGKRLSQWIELTKSPDADLRRQALDVIEKVAIPMLIEKTKSKVWQTRHEAIMHLGQSRSFATVAIPTISKLLEDPDESIRFCAAVALKRIDPETRAALPFVLAALDGNNEGQQLFAALALGEFGEEGIEPLLKALPRLYSSGPPGLGRSFVCNGLAHIGKPALPSLIHAMEDKNPLVRDGAANALLLMDISSEDARTAIPALRRLLNDADRHVRETAAQALQRWEK